MAPFYRSRTTSYHSAILRIALSCAIFETFDVKEYFGALELHHSPLIHFTQRQLVNILTLLSTLETTNTSHLLAGGLFVAC